jgi:hypothetical protein
MLLQHGKNKGDEGSLFQSLLAMAAAATTAMFFSPIPEIDGEFGFMPMGAAAAVAGAAIFTLLEMRRRGKVSLGRELTQDPAWASGNADRSVESTYNVTKAGRREGAMESSVDYDEACFGHESPCEDRDQLSSHLREPEF